MNIQNQHWLFGALAVAPFFALEGFTTSGFSRGIPWAVFIALFLEATCFVAVFVSGIKDAQEYPSRSRLPWLIIKILLLVVLALAFLYTVADQMPCFLGGSGC